MMVLNFDFHDRMSRLRRCQPVEQKQGFRKEKTLGKQFSLSTSAGKIISTLAASMNSRQIHNRHHDRQFQSRRLTKGSLIVALLTTLMMTISMQPIQSIALPRVAESIEVRKKHRQRLTKHRTSSYLFDSPPETMKRNFDATNSTIDTKKYIKFTANIIKFHNFKYLNSGIHSTRKQLLYPPPSITRRYGRNFHRLWHRICHSKQ
mmetsp:Transcript_19317/g.39670  ORF Transcript_19317/g.39670 Transcript_19317/m.39670 type:complete len:205 (-) Transcript_19317:2148-2762(-)